MKKILFLSILILLISIPVMAADVAIDISGSADGFQCYTMNFQKPYDFSVPDWEGPGPTANLTLPDDRFSEVQCQGWNWGPFDLQGNRIRIPGPLSDPQVFEPVVSPPAKPNIIIRILVAILDFFGPSFG